VAIFLAARTLYSDAQIAKPTMSLAELAQNGADTDLLREMIRFVAQRMMEMDAESLSGLPASPDRRGLPIPVDRCDLRDGTGRLGGPNAHAQHFPNAIGVHGDGATAKLAANRHYCHINQWIKFPIDNLC
jgi:hypothetical protein